jgi:hypothetical protein
VLPQVEYSSSDDDDAVDGDGGRQLRSEPAQYIVPPEYEVIGAAPTKLDQSLVSGSKFMIFQKWNVDGWCLGKLVHFYAKGVRIPGQPVRGNYGIKWVGDPRGSMRDCKLSLEEYFTPKSAHVMSEAVMKGAGSWVLLQRKVKSV